MCRVQVNGTRGCALCAFPEALTRSGKNREGDGKRGKTFFLPRLKRLLDSSTIKMKAKGIKSELAIYLLVYTYI